MLNQMSTIHDALKEMSRSGSDTPGLQVIVDESFKLVATVSDGDIRRALSRGATLDQPVVDIASNNPMWVTAADSIAEMRGEYLRKLVELNAPLDRYKFVVVVSESGHVERCIASKQLLDVPVEERTTAVIGLGFVGLTLAASLAAAGMRIVGYDDNAAVQRSISDGKPHFFEVGLEDLLSQTVVKRNLRFASSCDQMNADVYVIAVGTPVDENGQPDLDPLRDAVTEVASLLKHDDLIILRSTIPAGTCRQIVVPLLERSGFRIGEQIHLAFAPERTVEGNALEELKMLPQIIGGFNDQSAMLCERVFRKLTHSVVVVDSMEVAEMIKLINNTYRAINFALANEVSLLCDRFNTDAREVIRLANEGYPRSQVAAPSPGVGGICLDKDPVLFAFDIETTNTTGQFGLITRAVNKLIIDSILNKIQLFATHIHRNLDDLRILILGLAFKGQPETSDIRASISMSLIDRLPRLDQVTLADCVVQRLTDRKYQDRFIGSRVAQVFQNVDVVLTLNNHRLHTQLITTDMLRRHERYLLLFDGWGQFKRQEIEQCDNVIYASPGYIGLR